MIYLWIALGLFLLIMLAGLVIFRLASVPGKRATLMNMELLDTQIDNMLPIPVKEGFDFMRQHNPQELLMTSFDGTKLRGRWVPAENPRGTFLLLHGWSGSVERDFCCILSVYHAMGMNLLMVDQRGQNKSGGKYMTFGVKESRDAVAWVRYHNEKFGAQPLIIDGISMGASSALMAMEHDLPSNVKGVIADSGFTSPWAIICQVAKQSAHLPAFPFIYAAAFWCRVLAGYAPKKHSTVKAMRSSRLPVAMLHGKADNFVPYTMSVEAFDAYEGEKEILLVEEAGHGMSYLTDKDRCTEALERFINKVLLEEG